MREPAQYRIVEIDDPRRGEGDSNSDATTEHEEFSDGGGGEIDF